MFDITIPLMCSRTKGGIVLNVGDSSDWRFVRLCKGMLVVDLLKTWLGEAKAVLDRTRPRGLLPIQMRHDWKGRIGCVRGLGFVRKDDLIFISDVAEDGKSFLISPCDWWRCVQSSQVTGIDFLGQIPVASFAAWANKLDTVIYAYKCSTQTVRYDRDNRRRNAAILARVLGGISGGEELKAVLPPDFMKQLRFIRRCEDVVGGVEIGDEAGIEAFDGVQMEGRDERELVWWVEGELARDRVVFFLFPHKAADYSEVSVSLIWPDDNTAEILPCMLVDSHLGSDLVDHVVFSVPCALARTLGSGRRLTLPKKRFVYCLKYVKRMALGIIKESAWAELCVSRD